MSHEFDARLTFDTFVVGPANRLASAAARRAAESPGSGYNPLFLYSASGLGKSHILSAIAQHAQRMNPDATVHYETLEGYLDVLTRSLERGEDHDRGNRYRASDILLLDDVQFLTGQAEAQEMLLRTLDAVTGRGGQVVLASDRPPAEIDDLDARLLSRFSGGLIVDIGQPDYETRVAIMRRKAEDRGAELSRGVAEVMARYPFRNVRELQGALNRLLAVQELEERIVSESEVAEILGELQPRGKSGSPQATAEEGLAGAPPVTGGRTTPEEPEWRRAFRDVIEGVEAAGFSTQRLRRYLDSSSEPADWRGVLRHFRTDVDRLREMHEELERLGNPWPEAAETLLRDPERREEAESLLASARERARPFPPVPEGHTLDDLAARFPALAVRATQEMLSGDRPEYNPLYLHASEEGRLQLFLEGAARTFRAARPDGKIALVSVPEFAEEFIRAISDGVAGAWRERWWTVDLLLLRKIEGLAFTERAQEEFFHLFEALKRRGGRIMVAGDRPPSGLEGVEDRLRTRFEGGLVVELGRESDDRPVGRDLRTGDASPSSGTGGGDEDGKDVLAALREFAGVKEDGLRRETDAEKASSNDLIEAMGSQDAEDEEWYPHPERVVWVWPRLGDRIVEDEE